MGIINGIKSYINEDDTKIMIVNNKINIVNYNDIDHFDSEKIVIKLIDSKVIIKGSELAIAKLLKDEILITGKFSNLEFR